MNIWSQSDHRRREITLPQNWIIPETIQKRTYRNPWIIATKALIKPSKILKSRNNLDPNPKEREILRVTCVNYAISILIRNTISKYCFLCRTGNSEYMGTIGIAGENIMLRSRSPNMRDHASGLQNLNKRSWVCELECSLIFPLKQNLTLFEKIF